MNSPQSNATEIAARCRAKANALYRKNKLIAFNTHLDLAIRTAAEQYKIDANDIWAANSAFYKQLTFKAAEARALAAKAPKAIRVEQTEPKTFADVYRNWFANNDQAPSDQAICHFADVSPATLTYARKVLTAEGYTFESMGREKPWKVTTRPAAAPAEFTDLQAAMKAGNKEAAVKIFMGMLN